MSRHELQLRIVDEATRDRTVARFATVGIRLPTLAQLAEPERIPTAVEADLTGIDPDAPHPLNLFRVHWHNAADRKRRTTVPEHVVLPESLTGVRSPIIVALGNRFPMIRAHKVLAAYGCLVPRLVSGEFDPGRHRAVWPSTGNYCRGGVAISRILECRGVAVLPAGMSRERFQWLEKWVTEPTDIIRTPGTESNVKEIYDRCADLEADCANFIFNQFSEFANYLVHWRVTGPALARVFDTAATDRGWRLAAFTSATGSAGTIGAGDHLKTRYGARIVAAEALECPTLLENGFGEHNIQGIGDKHVPLIHNVMNTDLIAAVSDRATDELDVLFTSEVGRRYLIERRGVPADIVEQLGDIGFSGICNVLAAIKTARALELGPGDALVTVATDGSELYRSEHEKLLATRYPGGFDTIHAAEVFGHHVLGASTEGLLELTRAERRRIFNLGYYTWVEQQGTTLQAFQARRSQDFWQGLQAQLPLLDTMIDDMNVAVKRRRST